ncbi:MULTISPECIES: Gfo/Idh/MocA family protein [Actinomycetes]|uniref:Gfo/Idh/MocA family protein n=1 Tax=Actinomycetes TaxID=1760 RepID=UPI0001B57AAB|nr:MULTISPECIES: Gfo/Idh/MocA family oxidoreductase [Actinomycetes]EFL07545.1 oxidoreductase domain-containing protein [Streptomyces sp. AA4]
MVNPRVLRVGVVGVGLRAEIARHVAESGVAAEIVAASDPDEHGRARAREMFGDVEIGSEHHQLANRVDAAIVTSPDWTHAEIAVDLLRADVAVYLEKPLATTLPDADAVLAAAQETGSKLYIGHNFRHAAVVRTLRDVVTRGEIGEVKAVWCRHFVGNGGDYYFKDWHADRSRVNSLLLQKASHDLDVIHYLAGGFTRRVTAMGDLAVYGKITDRSGQGDRLADDWFSFDNWPPAAQTGLNPVVDVEDLSMVHMRLDNGVLASYEQCHFTPDYWRNYTVLGTEGRAENFGDTGGGVVKVWNRRRNWARDGDREYPIDGVESGHADADLLTMTEFLRYVVHGDPPELSPIAAREAVAAGALATQSLRSGSVPVDIPPLPETVAAHFSPPEGNRR